MSSLLPFLPALISVLFYGSIALVIYLLLSWVLEPIYKKRPKITIAILIVLGLFYIPFWRVFPGMPLAQYSCAVDGYSQGGKPITLDGYLRIGNPHSFQTSNIVERLLEQRFTFIEEENPEKIDPITKRKAYIYGNDLRKGALQLGEKYYRYYLAPSDSPACDGYHQWMASSQHTTREWIRAKGLPLNLCIAAIRTDELVSQYAFEIDQYRSGFLTEIEWTRARVKDLSSHRSLREYRMFNYMAFKILPMSAFHGIRYRCGSYKELQRFQKESILPTENRTSYDWLDLTPGTPLASFYAMKGKPVITDEFPYAKQLSIEAKAK